MMVISMKKIIILFMITLIFGCTEEIEKPDKIMIEKDIQDQEVTISEEVIDSEEDNDYILNLPKEKPEEPDEADIELNNKIEEDLKEINKNIPENVRELMKKSEGIITYSYYLDNDHYFVKDNKIHIAFSKNRGSVTDSSLYNNVLINLEKKKAYAWCTDSTYCGPSKPQIFWEIPFDDYEVVTPVDRLQSITNAKIINPDMSCEDRKSCMEIEFVDSDGITKRMWFYTYYPTVWKVQWHDASKGKDFIELYQNIVRKVSDEDVIIPPEYEYAQK